MAESWHCFGDGGEDFELIVRHLERDLCRMSCSCFMLKVISSLTFTDFDLSAKTTTTLWCYFISTRAGSSLKSASGVPERRSSPSGRPDVPWDTSAPETWARLHAILALHDFSSAYQQNLRPTYMSFKYGHLGHCYDGLGPGCSSGVIKENETSQNRFASNENCCLTTPTTSFPAKRRWNNCVAAKSLQVPIYKVPKFIAFCSIYSFSSANTRLYRGIRILVVFINLIYNCSSVCVYPPTFCFCMYWLFP